MKFHQPTLWIGLLLNCISALFRYGGGYTNIAEILLVVSLLVIVASYSLALLGVQFILLSLFSMGGMSEYLAEMCLSAVLGSLLIVYSWKKTRKPEQQQCAVVKIRHGRYRRIKRSMGIKNG